MTIAATGARCLLLTVASAVGSTLIRPIAYDMREAPFTPAFALAIVELTTARKTKNQKNPYRALAMPCQEAAALELMVKAANLPGPNATSTAYVVNT